MKLLQYLFDCTIIWFILFLIYHLLLRGETFFRMNRLYLISSLFFGLTLPFIRFINIHFGSAETIDNMLYPVSNALYLSPVYTESLTSDQSAKHLVIVFILLIYLSGVIYFSLSLFRGLRKIYMLYCNGDKFSNPDFTLIKTKSYHLPFSFFHFIFWSNQFSLPEIDYKKILHHEIVHIHQKHSLDILILEVLGIIFWWHPLIYWYKRAIRQNHEFICDQEVGNKSTAYQSLLNSEYVSNLQMALTHHFFKNHLKERIKMLKKNPSAKYLRYKVLVVFPLLLLFISLFAFQIADNEGDKQSPTETQKTDKARNVILKECLQASSISDEQLKCTKEIISKIYRSHLVYPQEAVNKKIEGTVIISITYNPDGSIEYQILKDDKEHVLSSKLTDFIMALKSLEVDIESLGLRTIFYPVFFDLDGQTNSQFIPDDALIVTAQGVINKITPNNNDNKNNILTPDTLSGGQIPTDQSVAINIQKVDKSSSGTKENGEVRVTAGNIVLKVGIDYIVNYETGKVKIISDKYQKSNLPVSVEFMPNTDQRSAQNDSLLLFFSATTPDSGRIEAYTHNNSKEEKPLIKYFDHKEIPIEKPAFITDDNLLTGEFIDRVSVMKGKSAIEKYGPQATGGVIEIYLKDGFKVENLKNSAPKQESEGPINLRVYPNPAYDHLNVSLQSNKQKIRIRYYLTDLTGKKILSGKEREVNGLINFEVDVISLPNGSYYFVLDDGNDRYQRAIQISR